MEREVTIQATDTASGEITGITHTPTPWQTEGCVSLVGESYLWCGGIQPVGGAKYRGHIASIQSADHIGGISIAEAEANAALIVKCCNAMPAIIELLEDIGNWMTDAGAGYERALITRVDAALKVLRNE